MKFGAVIVVLVSAAELSAQGGLGGLGGFGGPSIQGRGGAGGRRTDGLRIRPYVGVQAIYDSGLTSIAPGTDGKILTGGAGGIEVSGGAYGTKQWKRNQLQLSYAGDYRHYNNYKLWNGTDQSLGLNYGTVLSKKITLEGSVTAGTTNRAFGAVAAYSTSDAVNQPGLPTNSLFDVRTNYASGNGSLTYNLSNRTSFSFSGGGYQVRRRNAALVGVDGIQAKFDAAHRIDKRTTVGIDYSFMTFQFTRSFGDSYIHGAGVFVARQFGRFWELNARVGALNVETLSTRQVAIDPAIAAIIGVSVGSEVFYSNTILPSGTIRLTRNNARQGTIAFEVSRSVNPGNGVILTSQADFATATYSRRLSRTLNLNATYGYNRLRSIGLIAGTYKNQVGGVGLGWQVGRYTQVTARYDRRNSLITSANNYSLNGNRVTFGVTFTPSDIPVSLW